MDFLNHTSKIVTQEDGSISLREEAYLLASLDYIRILSQRAPYPYPIFPLVSFQLIGFLEPQMEGGNLKLRNETIICVGTFLLDL
ncbi:hypothetical protein DKX38_011864 [Salix brachista]|uniref:Uncharacterized protein n=1 Tax=Salix brachista TaxID=2182728 RepID=A0A5N5M0L7_9ROSI|nr:hypothetical protein DKX38_011864 [Salix brachista]